ncbi:MAG TPA: sigma factor-like helix-turn-helix DNA-binding protein [Terriglobales bacterium]|nr:sigma factor-like helix-turn-helix DNA-binding protein [Terriglobales bacterium]
MNVHISYKYAKAPDVEHEFSQQIRKLERRVQIYRPDLVHLHAIVDQSSARASEMLVSLNLRVPSGQLAAQESAPKAVTGVKRAFSELLKQLSKHKDLLRGEHHRRRMKSGNGKARTVPFEQTLAVAHPEIATGADINSYLNANLKRLERFIERELRYRMNTGALEPDQLAREEVLDEVVARALGEEEHKPELLSLQRWMYRLALNIMEHSADGEMEEDSKVHLEKSARKQNVKASDEPELQFHQPDETLSEESVIADNRVATPEEIAASDEMIGMVESSLLGAQPEDREAFILFAVEGFTVEEIAVTSDRSPEQIKQSIQAARERLRKAIQIPPRFKEKVLKDTQIA